MTFFLVEYMYIFLLLFRLLNFDMKVRVSKNYIYIIIDSNKEYYFI